jgi:outer membrane protein
MRIRHMTAALVAAVAFAPAAFAQDGGSADYNRFAVVGGYSIIQPKDTPIKGSDTYFEGGTAPTLSFNWYATENIAIELWGAVDKADYDLHGSNGKFGSASQQPVALSGQYHFGRADSSIRPFVGLGYFQSKISDVKSTDANLNQDLVKFESQKGGIATVGADFNINSNWFVRVDARYMKGSSELRNFVEHGDTDPGRKHDVNLNPWTLGFGIGARF